MYDLPLLHRQMMELIGIPNADKVVPDADEVPPQNPVSENQDMLTQAPVKAYEYQDHEAHMRVHMALKNDPQIAQEMQNSPAGQAIAGALDSHVREHLAFIFRKQIEEELGVELPPEDQPLPEDIEKRLSKLVADAADQMTGKKQQQAQAAQQAAQQQDPIIQQRERELGIREMDVQRKQQADAAKQQLEQQKIAAKQQLDQQKLGLLEEKMDAELQTDAAELQLQREKLDSELQVDAAELQLEQQKLALEERELAIKTDADEKKAAVSQEIEGIKLGREMAKDADGE